MGEHSFAARFDLGDAAAGKVGFKWLEMLKGKEDFGSGMRANGFFYFVGSDANFGAFGHRKQETNKVKNYKKLVEDDSVRAVRYGDL